MNDIEKRGEGGFGCYRIPAVICTAAGTLIVSYECRLTPDDWDTRAVGLRRSTDNGKTWSERVLPCRHDSLAVNNPVLCAMRDRGVLFLYQLNYERTFVRRSFDDGLTFSPEKEITDAFEDFRPAYDFNVCAVGPGHGIELKNSRIVIPVWLASNPERHHSPSVTASLVSDDSGVTWQGGDVITASDMLPNPNETTAVQLEDGSVMFNIRHQGKTRRRAVAVSPDGKRDFTEPVFDGGLKDPQCFASLLALPGKGLIAYSGCDSETARENLRIKFSLDSGTTWSPGIAVYDKAGYSDIAYSDGKIYCFFERDNLTALSVEVFANL